MHLVICLMPKVVSPSPFLPFLPSPSILSKFKAEEIFPQ